MLGLFDVRNGGRLIDAQGTFFRIASSNAATLGVDDGITVRVDSQLLGTFYPGDTLRLPKAGTRWELTTASANVVAQVNIGEGHIDSSRITGSVRMIDNGAAQTMEGRQYLASIARPALAGKCCIVGVMADTRTIAVRSVNLASDNAGSIGVFWGTGAPTDTPSNSAGAGAKLIGAADLAGITRWRGYSAAAAPTAGELPGVTSICGLAVKAADIREFTLKTPIVVPPGKGLWFVTPSVNCGITANLEIEDVG